MSLGVLWRARRWRELLNLIEGLPRDSAFVEAMVSDDAWALAVLARGDQGGKLPGRRMSEWSPEMEMLTNLHDRVGELIRSVVASAGGSPRRVPPAARPVTALDRVRSRGRMAEHRALVARMLPHQAGPVAGVPVSPPVVVSSVPDGPGTAWLRGRRG